MNESKIEERLQEMRAYYGTNATKEYRFRINSLKSLYSAITKHETRLMEALAKDLHKSHFESFATEISIVLQEIRFQIRHLKAWSKTRRIPTPLVFFPSRSHLYREPYGVVLIISPWNYPFHLLFNPLVGALAAGNCAMLKTSPLAPATAEVMEKIISCFPGEYISIWHGHREMNQALLKARFDYIFYTGSPAVGKVVMEAASKHLTPVSLELGGKSPCIVDCDANIRFAARRIAWGKTINAGQTCIAPDYLLVHRCVKEEFISEYKQAVISMFGTKPQASPDYPRIVSPLALKRLSGYLKEGEIVLGGTVDPDDLYLEPTIIEQAKPEAAVWHEEIFGPILPLREFDQTEEVIQFINSREKPLALYYFTRNRENIRKILNSTSSGGVCINDTLLHVANHRLPFGGVGHSGMGHYHGKYSFETFSRCKAIVCSGSAIDIPLKYPPYRGKLKLFQNFFNSGLPYRVNLWVQIQCSRNRNNRRNYSIRLISYGKYGFCRLLKNIFLKYALMNGYLRGHSYQKGIGKNNRELSSSRDCVNLCRW